VADQKPGAVGGELRTGLGDSLRAQFDKIRNDHLTVPAGRRGVLVGVFDQDGVGLGGAWVTPQGWLLAADLSVAVAEGKAKNPTARVFFTW